MKTCSTLNELIACDPQSRKLFQSLPPQQQVALQEQQQSIRTHAELENAVRGFHKQTDGWQAK